MLGVFFYDGKTATKHTVQLIFQTDNLQIIGSGEVHLAKWRFDELILIDQMKRGGMARISHPASPDARLVIEDRETFERLLSKAPALIPDRRKKATSIAGLAVLGVGALVAIYFGFGAFADRVAHLVPLSWVEPMGKQAADQVATVFSDETGKRRYCTAAAGKNALGKIVRQLSGAIGEENNFEIAVVRSEVVNAFAVPGGRILVFDGLLSDAQSVEEIAGVIAHEMGHALARHPTAGVIKHYGVSMIVGSLIGNETVATAAGLLVAFSYSRAAEQEADAIAIELLQKLGYGVSGLATFFARMAKKESKGFALPTMLSTHPSSAKRASRLREIAPPGRGIDAKIELNVLKSLC